MSGFDDPNVFFTVPFDNQHISQPRAAGSTNTELVERFKRFVREYQSVPNYDFIYRDQLKRNFALKKHFLFIRLEHLSNFDSELCDCIFSDPAFYIELFERSLISVVKEIHFDSNPDQAFAPDTSFQLLLMSNSRPVSIRNIKSDSVAKLVKIAGVVVSASTVKSRSLTVSLQCRNCNTILPNIEMQPGLDGLMLPRKCPNANNQQRTGAVCPIDPFFVLPDKCSCIDYQLLKLQELPELTPTGEIPRHISLYVDRCLSELVLPGSIIVVYGIFSVKKASVGGGGGASSANRVTAEIGLRKPYIRVVGLSLNNVDDLENFENDDEQVATFDNETNSASKNVYQSEYIQSEKKNFFNNNYFPDEITQVIDMILSKSKSCTNLKNFVFNKTEEEMFKNFSKTKNVYQTIVNNLAPSIYGSENIKAALAVLLFGGSRKRLPDGLIRRGDINVLLLGDPGTAKSQMLKYVQKIAPIAYYTSGKGSSAAGLTASLNKEANNSGFVIEGGAMVLADGGVVCIDEFDKMREDDRVAIHEAMEQQTISISKAGITTTLNSRCSVLAAANSVFGRWDDSRGQENIELMPTILSRFDLIFVIKDVHNQQSDMRLAEHVINVHISSDSKGLKSFKNTNSNNTNTNKTNKQTLDTAFLTRYIAYARQNCAPRISDSAMKKLQNFYVEMRKKSRDIELDTHQKSCIPLTVRQLEALVRISEALAKMKLQPFVEEADVEEAIRLFKVSTMDAMLMGTFSNIEGFSSKQDLDQVRQVERQLRIRLPVGTQVSEQRILSDFSRQNYTQQVVKGVISGMLKRGDLQYKMQKRVLYRIR